MFGLRRRYRTARALTSSWARVSGRGAPSSPQSLILRHPPRARMFFCFGSRAQRCRRLLTGDEEAGVRRRPEEASPPTSPTSDLQEGSGETSPDTTPKSSADRRAKEVAKPLPLLLPPASTPPVRRPRQRPLLNQWARRTSATPISHPAPSAARQNVFCFVSRAQRCRGHLTGGEESGDRRRPRDASPPTSPGSDEGVGCRE